MDNRNTRPFGSMTSSAETLQESGSTSPAQSKREGHEDATATTQPPKAHIDEKSSGSDLDERRERDGSQQIVTLPLSDPEHPNNWSRSKKAIVLSGGIITVLHSTIGSSLPSNAIQFIAETYNVTSKVQMVLPISCFLIGYCFAPTACGPLSENYGRKPVMMISYVLFIIVTMGCAVAPSWWSFLFFRFLCGLAASAPIACVAGIFADINVDPRKRGRSMAAFMVATIFGPVASPPVSGFIAENTSWRWVFAWGTFLMLATLPCVIFLPETYAPTLMSKKAARMRKETGNENIVAQSDVEDKGLRYIMTVVMTRPFRMLFRELIVSTTCLYLALCYGVFYLYFEAYPIIFLGEDSVYKFSPGLAGLTFLPIAIGACTAGGIFLLWDRYYAKAAERDEAWTKREESRRLPLAAMGGPMFAAAIFWLGWTARTDIYWLAPVASGIPFGAGFMLIFMGMLNYLSDAYMVFSASAQGIASTCRSLLGVLLPLAAHRMFVDLGIAWACSTLGFLCLAFCAIPWMFIIFGERIRAGSKFCQELHALLQKEMAEKEELERRVSHQDV